MFEIIKHNLKLLYFLKEKEVRRLPLRVLWQSFRLMQNEKITKIDNKLFINDFIPPFPSQAIAEYFKDYKKMAEGKFGPKRALISLTNRCNCQCEICYNKNYTGKEMSLEQIKKTIHELQDLGFFRIGLSGGEPTLRDDLEEIISCVEKKSFFVLLTNGCELTLENAKKFKKAGLEAVKIDLDHYKKEEVDNNKKFAGAFEKAIEAIKVSREANLYVATSLVVSKKFLEREEIYEYLDFVEKLGVNEVTVLEPKVYFCGEKSDYLLDEQDRKKLYDLHLKINKDRKRKIKVFVFEYFEHQKNFGCGAGLGSIYIDATGNVTPCPFVGLGLGNVKEESVASIYEKMKKCFLQPKDYCLSRAVKNEVEKNFQGQFPLNKEISEKILKKLKLGELPLENKKILKKFFNKN